VGTGGTGSSYGGYEHAGSGSGGYEHAGSGSGGYEHAGTGSGGYEQAGTGSGGYEQAGTGSGGYGQAGSGSYEPCSLNVAHCFDAAANCYEFSPWSDCDHIVDVCSALQMDCAK
jgi:hypothetical protein